MSDKITALHLSRDAYIYVRQSTTSQVMPMLMVRPNAWLKFERVENISRKALRCHSANGRC